MQKLHIYGVSNYGCIAYRDFFLHKVFRCISSSVGIFSPLALFSRSDELPHSLSVNCRDIYIFADLSINDSPPHLHRTPSDCSFHARNKFLKMGYVGRENVKRHETIKCTGFHSLSDMHSAKRRE